LLNITWRTGGEGEYAARKNIHTHKRSCVPPLTCSRTRTRTRVEAGSNTSTVTLRVVGGDESEIVKYGHESYGTRTRK
jgi:hypothetical protein